MIVVLSNEVASVAQYITRMLQSVIGVRVRTTDLAGQGSLHSISLRMFIDDEDKLFITVIVVFRYKQQCRTSKH